MWDIVFYEQLLLILLLLELADVVIVSEDESIAICTVCLETT